MGPGWQLRRLALLGGLALSILDTAAGSARAADFDAQLWNELLGRYTVAVDDRAGTRVDYEGLRQEPAWRLLIAGLRRFDPAQLASREERLAFWINAYNILAIETVLQNYPLESIRDAGSFLRPVWRRPAGVIGGRERSLHEIEHEILRPMGEPRIHFAIVCASTSCPSLAGESFTAPRLEEQLEAAVHRFLSDERKGLYLQRYRNRVRLSRIFDWFEADFESHGGALAFIAHHLSHQNDVPAADRRWISRQRDGIDVEYFDYDWALNERVASRGTARVR